MEGYAQGSKKERNSALELLRIVAMVLIVMSHYSVHGGINLNVLPLSANKVFLRMIQFGDLGTNIFVLISGYFLIYSSYRFQKLLRLLLQVWFYSVLLYGDICFDRFSRVFCAWSDKGAASNHF